MFKFIVVVLLFIIAFDAVTADINIITANVPMMNKGYVFINYNGNYETFAVPFNIPATYWSW